MDLLLVNVLISLASVAAMIGAIVYILTYILGSFSSKSGSMSLKFVLYTLFYFFGSTIILSIGVEWLMDLARSRAQAGTAFYLNIGASALALNAILHIFCGFLTALLYLKGRIS
jgi:hypothetical protein